MTLREHTNFDWDTAYVFREYTSSGKIGNILHLYYEGSEVPDDVHRLVFVKNGQIAHEEDYGGNGKYSLQFEPINDYGEYLVYPSNSIRFKVQKKKLLVCENCWVFILKPLRE
jgi:hypothetical protein